MAAKDRKADARTWYLKRGGLPTRAAEWRSKDQPDWVATEGDREWKPFETTKEAR